MEVETGLMHVRPFSAWIKKQLYCFYKLGEKHACACFCLCWYKEQVLKQFFGLWLHFDIALNRKLANKCFTLKTFTADPNIMSRHQSYHKIHDCYVISVVIMLKCVCFGFYQSWLNKIMYCLFNNCSHELLVSRGLATNGRTRSTEHNDSCLQPAYSK